jgi:hypothetical protein
MAEFQIKQTDGTDVAKVSKFLQINDFLIYQFQRVDKDPRNPNKEIKIHYDLDLPEEFDFSKYIADIDIRTNTAKPEGPQIYRLFPLIRHKGIGKESGHYIAAVNLRMTDKWWAFDDEKVFEMDDIDVISTHGQKAYLAFMFTKQKSNSISKALAQKNLLGQPKSQLKNQHLPRSRRKLRPKKPQFNETKEDEHTLIHLLE